MSQGAIQISRIFPNGGSKLSHPVLNLMMALTAKFSVFATAGEFLARQLPLDRYLIKF